MTLTQKIDHYAKALIAATGVIVLLVNQFTPVIPADAQPYVAAAVSALTAFGVWYKANGPKVGTVVDRVDRDPLT